MQQEGIYSYENIGLMPADEKELEEGSVDVLNAQGCGSMKTLHGELGAKKMWKACRALYDADSNLQKEFAVINAPIPQPEAVTIAEEWLHRPNFVLPYAQLLVPTNKGK